MRFTKPCVAMSTRAFQVCQRTGRALSWLRAAENKYARSDDVRIAYQVSGDGPFDVVWAPGTISHLDLDWKIPRLPESIFKISVFISSKEFPASGDSSRRAPGSAKSE